MNDGRGDLAHEGKSLCILRDSEICVGKVREYPQSDIDWKNNGVVQEDQSIQILGWNRWRTSGVRVEDIPRTHHTADSPKNPSIDDGMEL